jgi:hypothetical protein
MDCMGRSPGSYSLYYHAPPDKEVANVERLLLTGFYHVNIESSIYLYVYISNDTCLYPCISIRWATTPHRITLSRFSAILSEHLESLRLSRVHRRHYRRLQYI